MPSPSGADPDEPPLELDVADSARVRLLELADDDATAYAAFGAAPATSGILLVEGPDGRALNHFNKLHKGRLVRALAESGAAVSSREDLLDWSRGSGVRLEARGERDVVLLAEG